MIRTYILRLLVDSEHPDEICGALKPVDREGETFSFNSEAALLGLLRRLSAGNQAGAPACAPPEGPTGAPMPPAG